MASRSGTKKERKGAAPHQAYPVRTVARLTGLTPDLIRAWERRYQVVEPIRGPRGARLYNLDDVTQLRLLAALVARGRAIGDIARLDRATLTSMVELVEAPTTPASGDRSARSGTDADVIERVLDAIARFDTAQAEARLGEALLALGATDFVCRVGMPLLCAVGERWQQGTLSVAEEHMLSAMLRSLLSSLGRMRGVRGAPAILLATPSRERHELGLSLVALLCLEAALPVAYLGADLPADEIARAAVETRVAVVGLSLVNRDGRREARDAVRVIEARLAPEVELWLGGAQAPEVARTLSRSRALVLQDIAEVEAHIRRIAAARPPHPPGS
jgi:DNA-binding transcriptional MerR regulator/methylmalonyl-CoA mutase cobalamin-binding subunit